MESSQLRGNECAVQTSGMCRNKGETRSGDVCTIRLSHNSLMPRCAYAVCSTVFYQGSKIEPDRPHPKFFSQDKHETQQHAGQLISIQGHII